MTGGGGWRGDAAGGGYRSLPRFLLLSADLILRILKWIAHEMQYQLSTLGDAMYAPWDRSSFASVCSTRLSLEVTFLALSLGTVCPQLEHWTTPVDPFPPLVRPLLARLSGMWLRGFSYL